MTTRHAAAVALVLCALGFPVAAFAVHNVPNYEQDGVSNCGPTAAGSCLKWWQMNGYPDLVSRTDSTTKEAYKRQLEGDAGTTDTDGTDVQDLADAMNKLVNEGPDEEDGVYKGRLRARVAQSADSANTNFSFLDSEFSHNEDILMLVSYGDTSHYVTVRNVTGTGKNRTVEYMDPVDGMVHTTTLTDNGDQIDLTYRGPNGDAHSGTVGELLTMSPDHTTFSRLDDTQPPAGTRIVYTVYYANHAPCLDLHILVTDCVLSHYTVTGLPAGWTVEMKTTVIGGVTYCYLTMFKGPGGANLPSGAEIKVTYTGTGDVGEAAKVITQSTTGTNALPTGLPNPVRADDGISVVSAEPAPDAPGRAACEIVPEPSGHLAAHLSWTPSTDPTVVEYEIHESNTRELLGVSPGPSITLLGLPFDSPLRLTVCARNAAHRLSDDSEPITLFRDSTRAPVLEPGGPATIGYTPPTHSWHGPAAWNVVLPGTFGSGTLYIDRIGAQPSPPIDGAPGTVHEPYFHLSSNAGIFPGPIPVALPYNRASVHGSESALRLYNRIGGVWVDVTTGVDVLGHRIFGTLQELGSFAIVNGSPPTSVAPVGRGAGLRFESVRPNPTSARTALAYVLPSAGDVRLAIYDQSGRRVREVVAESQVAGRHQATWDGCDSAGGRVRAGVYWARLTLERETVATKLVVVR